MKMMIKTLFAISSALMVGSAQATLLDRGGGMIYDNVLNITWLQDANYAKTSGYDADGVMTWQVANSWASNLVYGGFDDWRLPTNDPLNGVSYQGLTPNYYTGSSDYGYNISAAGTLYAGSTASEMAYMYYNNFGNNAYYSINGSVQVPHGIIDDPLNPNDESLFINISRSLSYSYWSGTETGPNNVGAWYFDMMGGIQMGFAKTYQGYAWAVRDGDVAPPPPPPCENCEPPATNDIPEPSTLLLAGLALAGVGAAKRRGFIGRS